MYEAWYQAEDWNERCRERVEETIGQVSDFEVVNTNGDWFAWHVQCKMPVVSPKDLVRSSVRRRSGLWTASVRT